MYGVTGYEHCVKLMEWMSPCGYRFIKEGELEKNEPERDDEVVRDS